MALYRSPDYQTGFELVGLSVQEKKFNIDFQKWRPPWISNENNFS